MTTPDSPDRRRTPWHLFLLVACLAAVPFLPILSNGFVWDDHVLIVNNPDLERPWSALTRMHALGSYLTPYYRPLPVLFWGAQRHLFGYNPFGYHLTSILLHALVTVLVLVVARRYLSVAAALAAAALFAVHPVHVEPVAFASLGAVDLLSSVLILLATAVLVREAGPSGAPAPARAAILFSAGLFFLAVCTKESVIGFPVIAAGILVFGSGGSWRTVGPRLAPFLFALGAYGAVRVLVARSASAMPLTELARPALWALPAWALASLKGLVFPVPLLPYHDLRSLSPAQAVLLLGFGAVVALAGWLLLREGKRGLAAVALGLLIVPLLPTAPLVSRPGALMAERFLYLPSAGAAILAASVLESRLVFANAAARVLAAVGAALVIAIGVVTWGATKDWRDDETLFSRAVARDPGSVGLNYLLGDALVHEGRYAEAEPPLLRALAADPDFVKAAVRIGDVYRMTGRVGESRSSYRRALAAAPQSAEAHFGLGSLEMDFGASADAVRELETALSLNPALAGARLNLGFLAYRAGDLARAEEHWRRALDLEPRNAMAKNNLGVIARGQGRIKDARRLFTEALDADPDYSDARRNLSSLPPQSAGQ